MKLIHLSIGAVTAVLVTFSPLRSAEVLTPQSPLELTGTQGKFDFIKMDQARHRLLACHTGNGSLDVIDVAAPALLKSVPTGAAQGVAIDDRNGLYYVSVSKPPQLVIIDAAKLEITGTVPLPAAADLVACHPETNRVYVCNDEKPEIWVIDPVAKKILTTVVFPGGGMEDLDFDGPGHFLYQNLKDSSQLARLDLSDNKVGPAWSTLPAEKPHGLAMVPGAGMVLIVGGTGKLALMNLATGEIAASADIVPRIDELAYDPALKRAYGASGTGTLAAVSVEDKKLSPLPSTPTSAGAHSVAVDVETHTVWITYAKGTKAYAQGFLAK